MLVVVSRLRKGLGCRQTLPEKSRERLHARPAKFERRQMKGGRPHAPAPLLRAQGTDLAA